jgi:hypothetical protein
MEIKLEILSKKKHIFYIIICIDEIAVFLKIVNYEVAKKNICFSINPQYFAYNLTIRR